MAGAQPRRGMEAIARAAQRGRGARCARRGGARAARGSMAAQSAWIL